MSEQAVLSIVELIEKIKSQPEQVAFAEVIATISAHYQYTPTAFRNGVGEDVVASAAGTNEGSCKIFAFARLNDLSESETLACFGDYYRVDVLQHPEGSDHGNIRTFMKYGWAGIEFDGVVLVPLAG